jgi:hypothetical protein
MKGCDYEREMAKHKAHALHKLTNSSSGTVAHW